MNGLHHQMTTQTILSITLAPFIVLALHMFRDIIENDAKNFTTGQNSKYLQLTIIYALFAFKVINL